MGFNFGGKSDWFGDSNELENKVYTMPSVGLTNSVPARYCSTMRKVSSRILGYALSAGIILILGACLMPVDVQTFLDDDKVQEIINKDKTRITITLPGIGGDDPDLSEGGEVIVPGDGSVTITITVTNASEYDGGIEWYCNSDIPLTPSQGVSPWGGNELDITAGDDPFDIPEILRYLVTVIGVKDGLPYSTYFYIIIDE